ncbi:hypothetical protein AOXY_G37210 [Acipenser oxyrinchus oxyrinchus]|uniref:Uncharacterized protein n=1 Tax=Acipenser oxyrinchus oxyrinchus TaxID=40147 RepID=A0AAD8CG88_ACIOX|nr:hypothetical protein AOXY_G37210 [Acipenser oxyrinchus oxyrinchus]
MDLDYFFRGIRGNEDRYLQSLEQICRKYSAEREDSIIVDLETMTCQTPDGILPWDGEVVYSKELKRKKKLIDKQKKCKVWIFSSVYCNDSRYSETGQDSADGRSIQVNRIHDCDIRISEDTMDNSNFLQDLHSDEEKTVNEDDSMSSETAHDCVASNQTVSSVFLLGDDCIMLEASQNPAEDETLEGPSEIGGVLSMDVGKQYRVDVDILMQDEEDLPGYVLVDWVQKSQQSPNNFENSMGYHGERNKEHASLRESICNQSMFFLQHAELQTNPLEIAQIPKNYTCLVGGGHKQSPLKVIQGKDGIIFVKMQNPVSPTIPSSKLFSRGHPDC